MAAAFSRGAAEPPSTCPSRPGWNKLRGNTQEVNVALLYGSRPRRAAIDDADRRRSRDGAPMAQAAFPLRRHVGTAQEGYTPPVPFQRDKRIWRMQFRKIYTVIIGLCKENAPLHLRHAELLALCELNRWMTPRELKCMDEFSRNFFRKSSENAWVGIKQPGAINPHHRR
jgi:hypothetical protein